MEEYVEWLMLPHDLQIGFFEEAEKESIDLASRIEDISKVLRDATHLLKPFVKNLSDNEELYVVSAVDGSRSPQLSERLGVRYGVFSVGIKIIKGLESKEEILKAGVFKRKQAFSQDLSRHFFEVLVTYHERKLALEALKKSDLVLIDGSFYGFLFHALRTKTPEESETLKKIVQETFKLSEELINSGKVIAIVKRSPSRAIGGYFAFINKRDNPYTTLLDKFILSFVMPRKTIFYYDDLLGTERHIIFYNSIASMIRRYDSMDTVIEKAHENIISPFMRLELPEDALNILARAQVRAFDGVPTCEIEYPRHISKENLERWLAQPNFFNEGTGLPLVLDLVDNLISIPSRFTNEFVNEIEARTLEKLGGSDPDILKLYFSYLNPQKPL
ncbi:MAG: DNA double-strand break repair nuclease NurA [Halobacteria archaeon]